MTKPVSIQQRIRILDAQGVSWREIARRLGVSRDTVRKYATMEDCSPKPAVRKGRRSPIDAYSGTVDSWLFADRLMPRKQRHTARRVYARLVEEEGFEGSYSSVQRYVKRWREEHRSDGDGYLELDWSAASCRSISARPSPRSAGATSRCTAWSPRSRTRTCVTWPRCRARTRNACARGWPRSSTTSAWFPACWCSTTPPVRATASRGTR